MKSFPLAKYFRYYRGYSKSNKKEYYKQFIQQSDAQSIYDLINQLPSHSLYIDKHIRTRNFNFGDSSFKVSLKVGTPKEIFDYKFHKAHHKIFVYKSTFHKFRSYTNCHFLNDKLFYVHICFPEAVHVEKDVRKALEKKYEFILHGTGSDFLLFNAQNDKLLANKDVNLNLYYISGNKRFSNLLQQHLYYLEKLKNNEKTIYSNYLENLL